MLIFLLIFIVGTVLMQVGIWQLLKVLSPLPRTADVVTSARHAGRISRLPIFQPTEQHNQFPWQDLAQLRQEKAQLFDQLGWKTDPETQTPEIPDSIIAQLQKERPSPAGVQSAGSTFHRQCPSVTDDTHTGVPQ